MIWNIVRTALAVQLLLVFLLGCSLTDHYVANPDAVPVVQGQVSQLVVSGGIKLVNAQSDNTDQTIAQLSGVTFVCNYQQVTDAAIDIARQVLAKHGVTVSNNPTKMLRLAVVDVGRPSALRKFRTAIGLQVEYGNDEQALFKGVSDPGDNFYLAYNGAVMKAVVAMLNDTRIRTYLEE